MNQLSPSVGFIYKPTIFSRIFFNYSTSFLTPTTSELSNRPDAAGGFNPDLNPEKIYQLESGTEISFTEINTSISAAFYFLNFNDLIIPYQVSGSEEVFFRNAGKAENKGLELMTESYFLNNLRVTISYTIMDFIFKDYIVEYENNTYQLKRNEIPGAPQQIFFFQLDYLNKDSFQGKIKFNFVEEYFANDFNGTPQGSESAKENFINKSYLKTDLRLGYNFSFDLFSANLFLGINNLFNVRYNGSVVPNAFGERYFEPAPGRNWYAGFQIIY
jgi:iron complex outermembrane receptor protein